MSKQTDLINVTDAITVDGSNNVGIGTSSPKSKLDLNLGSGNVTSSPSGSYSDYAVALYGSTTGGSIRNFIGVGEGSAVAAGIGFVDTGSGGAQGVTFNTGNLSSTTESMRISAGNLLVGQTSAASSDTGHIFAPDGIAFHVRDGGVPLVVDRHSSDGDLQLFRKNGTVVGSIGVANSDNLRISCLTSNHPGLEFGGTSIQPIYNNAGSDNVVDMGYITARFDDIYATNGTIQTSDRNEKQDIEALNDAETAVAVACKGLLRKFRWIDAVAEKGDDARIHFGIIAQDLQDAFTAEGLDAGRYAMFISSTWWETQTDVPAVEAVDEVLDEDGNVVTEAVEAKEAYTRTDTYETLEEAPEGATERTRLGVRYPELLAFIIGAM
jgi:hypothetical protein